MNIFGCGRAVSAHIERKKSKLDYALGQAPTDADVTMLETKINETIDRHLDVTFETITQQEAQEHFDLKRLPDNASEMVRVVRVGDYDECLCIGLHVANTREIGHVKILSHSYDNERQIWRMRFTLVH